MRASLFVTLLAIGACSSEARTPQTHQVTIRGMKFEPSALVVARGDTVVWTNVDVVPHTATTAGGFDSQVIASQGRWEHVTTEAGVFRYVCALHPTMQGTLTVAPVMLD